MADINLATYQHFFVDKSILFDQCKALGATDKVAEILKNTHYHARVDICLDGETGFVKTIDVNVWPSNTFYRNESGWSRNDQDEWIHTSLSESHND